MGRFVKLRDPNNNIDVYVNPMHVTHVMEDAAGRCQLFMVNDLRLIVERTPEQVIQLLENPPAE